MRVLRWILIAAAALVALAATALITLTLLINPDRYRGDIERVVSHATGRPFVIEGHLSLTWFPWLGVRMGRARLGAAPDQPGPDLIDWSSARLSVSLLPLLLHRQVVIGPIRLRGAVIHLWRGPRGRGNWQDLLTHTGTGTSAAPAVIGGLTLTDGALYFQSQGKTVSVSHWQLHVSAWEPGTPLTIRSRFVLQGGPLPPAGLPVVLRLSHLRFTLAPLMVSAPAASLELADTSIQGSATVSRGADGLTGEGTAALSVPSVRGLIGRLGLKMRLPKNPAALGALALDGHWRLTDEGLAVKPLTGRLDATALSGWLDRSGGAQPLWTFSLDADQVDFERYLPPARKHPKPFAVPVRALRALHARGTLTVARATFGKTTLRDLRLQVQ